MDHALSSACSLVGGNYTDSEKWEGTVHCVLEASWIPEGMNILNGKFCSRPHTFLTLQPPDAHFARWRNSEHSWCSIFDFSAQEIFNDAAKKNNLVH